MVTTKSCGLLMNIKASQMSHFDDVCEPLSFEHCQKPNIYFSSFGVIELVDIHVIPPDFPGAP